MGTESTKKPNAVARFFEKVDTKLRKTRFINRIVSAYEGVGAPGKGDMRSASPFLHPIDFYHDAKGTAVKKNRSGNNANEPNAVGETIRWRLINGPELNILLFGVPFLIDFAVSGIHNEVKKAKQKKKLKPGQRTRVRVEVDKPWVSTFKKTATDTLNPAPFSDKAQTNLYPGPHQRRNDQGGGQEIRLWRVRRMELSDHLSPRMSRQRRLPDR